MHSQPRAEIQTRSTAAETGRLMWSERQAARLNAAPAVADARRVWEERIGKPPEKPVE